MRKRIEQQQDSIYLKLPPIRGGGRLVVTEGNRLVIVRPSKRVAEGQRIKGNPSIR